MDLSLHIKKTESKKLAEIIPIPHRNNSCDKQGIPMKLQNKKF